MARVARARFDGHILIIACTRNLTPWAEAGVLMLNTCLTVRAHSAGSHQGKGWEQFTDRVIEAVDRYGGANLGEKSGVGRGVVFLAWGAWAAKRVAKLSKVRARGSRALDP
jgi:uracil-DNA glycosylase